MVNDHRGPVSVRFITRLIYCLIFLFGVTGNAIVSYSIIGRRRRQPIHKFTLNLALSDLILLLVYLPTQFTLYEAQERWVLGEFTCRLTYSVVPITLTSSIGFLVVITVDRFRAVCFPLSSKISTFQIRLIIATVWIMAIIVSVPLLVVSGTDEDPKGSGNFYCYEIRWPSPTVERIYWISLFLIEYALPLVILITLYPVIIYHLRTGRTISEGTSARRTSIDRYRRQQTKLIRVVIVLIILYGICMLPQHLVFFWTTYGDFSVFGSYQGYIYQMANALVLLNSALNPLCYGALGKKYNQSIWICLATSCCKAVCGRNKPAIQIKTSNTSYECFKGRCLCCFPNEHVRPHNRTGNSRYFSDTYYSDEKYCLRAYASNTKEKTDNREGTSKLPDRQRNRARRFDKEEGRKVRFQRASARTEITDCQFSSFKRSVSYRRSSQRASHDFQNKDRTSNFLTVEKAFKAEKRYSSVRSNGSIHRKAENSEQLDEEYENCLLESVDVNFTIQKDEIKISLLSDMRNECNEIDELKQKETDI